MDEPVNPLQNIISQQLSPSDSPDPSKKKNDLLKSGAEVCKSYKRKLIPSWTTSIDYRRGKPFPSQTDEDRIAVPLDWTLTKAKQASLFSQVPKIRLDHHPQTQVVGPWVQKFEERINDTLITAGIESAMDEVLPDCINAAGVGVILVAHEAITEQVQVPAIDLATFPPQIAEQINSTQMMPDGSPIPMDTVPKILDHRYTISRISPADLLWPIDFTGSDFDNGPWIGRSGRITWPQAVQRFQLTPEDKETVCGDDRKLQDKLTHDVDKDKVADQMVSFDEIFYKSFHYDQEAKSFSTIHHVVFVNGKDEPVIDEPWKGQKETTNPDGSTSLIGSMKFPIRVLTLAYITDEAIPPSDSAMGRPQVQELNKSRTQAMLQRERSLPIRWFDVNRVDISIQQSLMRGTWQAMIPVQGRGDTIIGEVQRAKMPPENYQFDVVMKNDLTEVWQTGQLGSGSNVETKAESNNLRDDMVTRQARERAKVGKYFVSIGEVLGGLLCLFEEASTFGEGFDPSICKTLSYSILADSTVLLDSNQRLKKLVDFINFTAKSGWIDVGPVLKEIATLSGLDPNVVVKPPSPKPPAEPNISLRLTGVEDMSNPLALAFLIKSGQAPPPELIELAKQLIQQAVVPPVPPPSPQGGPGQPPVGPDGQPLPVPPTPPVPPPVPAPPGGPQVPPPPPPAVGPAPPQWGVNPHISQRTENPDEAGG